MNALEESAKALEYFEAQMTMRTIAIMDFVNKTQGMSKETDIAHGRAELQFQNEWIGN